MVKAVMIDMDDARKARFKKVCDLIVDLCHRELESPLEAYAVISLVKESFEDTYGFKRSIPFKTEGVQ